MKLILASGSPYRAQVLREAGYLIEVDAPQVDERSFDHLFVESGAATLAVELARMKADDVAPRHPGLPVVAGDQVGVLATGEGVRMLTKAATVEEAVEQLVSMSGTRHELVNGIVVARLDADGSMSTRAGSESIVVQMASYDEAAARRYVKAHRPFDTAGSYRIEDDAGLVESVQGEDTTGVLGMPVKLLARLLAQLGTGEGVGEGLAD